MLELNNSFEDYFTKIYQDRWPQLRASLLLKEAQCARWNGHLGTVPVTLPIEVEKTTTDGDEKKSVSRATEFLKSCFLDFKSQPSPNEDGLLNFYWMDPASVMVARALDVQPGERVLDMCAAPGGKTLILSEALFSNEAAEERNEQGELIANEISESRRERLKKVIQLYVPRKKRERVWLKGLDGAQFGLREPETFDRILVDAPCSGERHLLENPAEYKAWSLRRTKGLAQRQYSLICGALLALKPGGRLVYSTCSISPLENDEVIEKFLKKKGDRIAVKNAKDVLQQTALAQSAIDFEETSYGLQFLPDRCHFGPMYFSVLEKNSL